MTPYRHHIAIIVPASQQDAANQGAAALTGRPLDERTFRDEPGRRFTGDEGGVYLLAGPTPMTEEAVEGVRILAGEDFEPVHMPSDRAEKFRTLAEELNVDAHWETIAVWDGGRVPLTTVDEWASSLGLEREPVPEEPEIDAVNVNTATSDELQTLDGVGPSLAQKIIDDRPYDEVDDLTRVSGISQDMVDGWEVVV